MPFRSVLLIPLVVTALAAGALGYFVAEELRPPQPSRSVSVISLPPTPEPEPTPEPTPVSTRSRIRVRNGETSGSCPAGCTCDQQPNGIIIRCTGG